jgi:type IV secretory pathway VirJ component
MNPVLARVRRFALGLVLALAFALPGTLAAPAAPAQEQPAPHTVSHGQFDNVLVFRPSGVVEQFVLLFSGAVSPGAGDRALARSMAAKGAMVAIVALPPFYRRIAAASARCVYAGGAVENLARYVQAFEKLPTYIEPMLVGSAGGGSFVYALLAQAPADTFSAALSLGYCPRLPLEMPLCVGQALQWRAAGGGAVELQPADKLAAPWTVLQAESQPACAAAAKAFVDRVPQAEWVPQSPAAAQPADFDAAYDELASHRAELGAPPAQLADLPIVEVPAGGAGTRFAVLLSGDGGWASIDKHLAAGLAKAGVPVAGIDSLRYFWTARTPDAIAADLDRVIRYYASRWKRSEVILIGYSQGADVLPFAFNRLPPPTRASVRLSALLGPGPKAAFEFHVTNWIGGQGHHPVAPELRKMPPAGTLCVYGADEHDSLCPQLAPGEARVLALPGGHHLGGDYDALAARILESVPR